MTNNINKVNCISLFSGIGGFEVGMKPLGFHFLKTIEIDKKCCETLKENKEYIGVIDEEIRPMDITKVKPKELGLNNIDYMVGGPPCQSFSACGLRKGTEDSRGLLFTYYCDYVKYFKPKAFVFENVRGILSSKKGKDFNIICKEFEKIGYKIYWRLLNAADYGVPQQRERVFIVGIRSDIGIDFKFPRPLYGEDSITKIPYVTVGDVIGDIEEQEVVKEFNGKYAYLLKDIPLGDNYSYYTKERGYPNPVFEWRSKFSSFLYKMNPHDICRTITASPRKYDGPFHWHNRKCTIEELKRLQGFPQDYKIPQSYRVGVKQIGNSVCPPIATQIGKALRYQIEGLEEFKVDLLDLDEKLHFDKIKRIKAEETKRIKQRTKGEKYK